MLSSGAEMKWELDSAQGWLQLPPLWMSLSLLGPSSGFCPIHSSRPSDTISSSLNHTSCLDGPWRVSYSPWLDADCYSAGKLLNHFKLFLSAICSMLLRKTQETNGIDKWELYTFLSFWSKNVISHHFAVYKYFLGIVSFNSHINIGAWFFFNHHLLHH